MKVYKGYDIDCTTFYSEAQIDGHILNYDTERYAQACKLFAYSPSLELSDACERWATVLHNVHGLDWDEIEAIELDAVLNA